MVQTRGRSEKFELVIDAKVPAVSKVKQLEAELERLGGTEAVKAQRQINRLGREIRLLGGESGKTKAVFTKLTGAIATGTIISNLTARAFSAVRKVLSEMFIETTKTAARTQVLHRVLHIVGRTAGIASVELKANTESLKALGIAEQEAITLSLRFMQNNLKLADTLKVARAAQDLAVISQENSSETALTITNAIIRQRPVLLKQFGINLGLVQIYGKLANQLGKTRDELTDVEKKQAFLNVVMAKAKTVAGVYEAAMEDVGKRVTSLARHYQHAKEAVGRFFLPAMRLGVDAAENFLKAITAFFGGETKRDPLEQLTTSFEALAIKIAQVNSDFENGITTLKTYRKAIDELTVQVEEVGVKTRKELVKVILESTRNEQKALETLSEAYRRNQLSVKDYLIASKEIRAEFGRLVAAAEAAKRTKGIDVTEVLGDWLTFTKEHGGPIGIMIQKFGEDTIDELRDILISEIEMGTVFASPEQAAEKLIKFYGFDPELVGELLRTDIQRGLEEATRNLNAIFPGWAKPWGLALPPIDITKELDEELEEEKNIWAEHLMWLSNERLKTFNRSMDEMMELRDEELEEIRKREEEEILIARRKAEEITDVMEDMINAIRRGGNIAKNIMNSLLNTLIELIIEKATKAIAASLAGTAVAIAALKREMVAVKALQVQYMILNALRAGGSAAGAVATSGASAGGSGGGLPFDPGKVFPLFDDPISDAVLSREFRRMGAFAARGLAQSGTEELARGRGTVNEYYITINAESKSIKEIMEEIEELSDEGFTTIRTN